MARKPALAIVCGPTASGKSDFAISLAQALTSEVVCADSRQVFAEMQIGSARLTEAEMQGIRHHLCGHISITETWHAGRFEQEALRVIERLLVQQKIPVVCGGTGLYLKALCSGLDPLPPRDELLRRDLKEILNTHGVKALAAILLNMDAEAGNSIDLQNPQRVMRAIELLKTSKSDSLSALKLPNKLERNFRCVFIGMETDRKLLYERINQRVDRMMEAGLAEEVKKLYPWRHLESMQTVGYSELFRWMDGEFSLEDAIETIKQNTRRYAKRQLTWLRNQANVNWVHPEDPEALKQTIQLLLK